MREGKISRKIAPVDGNLRALIRQKILDAEAAPVPEFTRRDIYVPRVPGKAVAVIGVRRAGKTTFLWQILKERLDQGTPRAGTLFFSFDDERLADLRAQDLHLLLEEYYSLHPEWRDQKRALFLLDEIQMVPGWERFLRRILDTENIEVFFAGSSARMLSREIATSMRGRAVEARVYPFSFREFLRHRGKEPTAPLRLPKARRSELQHLLLTYLDIGGFPEVQQVSARDRWDLLRGYVDIVLLRDVIERYQVTRPVALRALVRHLLANPAGLFSIHRFYRDLKSRGIAVSKDTLYAFLSYLEDAFLIHSVFLATASERQRMANPRKVYPVDPGWIPIFQPTGSPALSKALETVVAIELLRRGGQLSYVRTPEGFEVDFHVLWPQGKEELIQVTLSLDDEETRHREIRALVSASRIFPRARRLLLPLYPPPLGISIPPEIHLTTALDWLLTPPENP